MLIKHKVLPDFNPHHPQGGDWTVSVLNMKRRIAIHTTRKVVTPADPSVGVGREISIHTTRKVVTCDMGEYVIIAGISIHTTRKVVTRGSVM